MKKSKNTKKDKQNQTTVFPSNEVMMMLEQMNDGIAVIAEQSIDTSKKLDEFREETNNRFDNLETKVDNLEVKVDNLEVKTDNLQDDVTEIKHKLSEKVDRDEFVKLEKRMLKLEKLVLNKAV